MEEDLSFLSELRRRSVFRVSAAYVVASWLIIQVVSAIRSPLNLPAWFETVVVVLLGIGFFVAIILAWAFELTPDGIRPSTSAADSDSNQRGVALDYVLIAGLAIVAVATIWGRMPMAPVSQQPMTTASEQGQSIAVLPFADMSPNGDQVYFGDGIAEELLNELTRMDGLYVASRTSSFSYRDGEENLRAVGEALGVRSILEGSVRKDGDRIRVTAQLIDAASDRHLWSETYDRELEDIFQVQSEIASSVSGELGVRLGVGNVNSFPGAGTRSVEAYEAYLMGTQLNSNLPRARQLSLLEQALELDPDYAAASAALGLFIGSAMWISQPEDAPAILDLADPYLQRAIELDPNSAYAHTLSAVGNYPRMDWLNSEQSFAAALSISRNQETLQHHANMLMRTGRSSSALARRREVASMSRTPLYPGTLRMNVHLAQNNINEAMEIARQAEESDRPNMRLLIALNENDPNTVVAAIDALPRGTIAATTVFRPIRDEFDDREGALSLLRSLYADTEVEWPSKYHDIALLAAYFDDPEFSLEVFSNEVRYTPVRFGALWYPVMSEVRQLPQFKDLVTEVNLVDYWRAYGWSDFCAPEGVDDFTCF